MKTSGIIGSALFILLTLSAASSYGDERVKNGDFENGETAPWKLSAPGENVTLSIVPDSGSPCAPCQ